MNRLGWILALVVLVVPAGCGSGRRARGPVARGRAVYLARCASCHGERLEGKRSAPSLTGIARHWDAGGLARYLEDPGAVTQRDPRLLHLSGRYTLRMPSFAFLPPAERNDLLAFLLADAELQR